MGATATINPAVADYVSERDDLINRIEITQQNAKARNGGQGEPTDEDLELIKGMQSRIRKLDGYIDVLGNDMSMDEETANKLRRTNPGLVPQVPKYRSAGQFMADFMRSQWGNPNDPDHREAKQRYDLVLKRAEEAQFTEPGPVSVVHSRAAEHMGTQAGLTTPVAGGIGGMLVDPVVGPIINVLPQGQPFLTAIGKQPAPNSLSFLRPQVSDPDFDTGASAQGLQKAELVSKKFDVTSQTLQLVTIGGYLNVSQQLISMHPAGWDLILSQLRARVARQGELGAIAELSNSTSSVTLSPTANANDTWKALVQAARMVAQATNMQATWIAYGPLGWERLAGTTDLDGRPVFPALGPVNAFGQASLGDEDINLSGLRPIYTTAISDIGIWIGNSLSFEAFAFPFPVLEAVEPSVFGRQVAVAEALAFFRPVANSAVRVGP